ncbi:DUF2752 domain-containing protein [Zeaxanthinibacter sp. PT1]|uniref:DUF2752 domain-containing protein n=1 Tax=Zeaxanthinibacter TaxID=561554 RepID=UPI0023498331|nr:DUF2752 domain-containing protein [Zeaxanthinibacter sp. PT1]MDC6352130.1 DUF2752 domain-containing protein [Zeaxanthinibacter sp. PT1]
MKLQPTIAITSGKDYMLPCLNKQIFGFECPGCGIQRSFWLLLEGKFGEAFLMYPAIFPLILLFAFLIADRFIRIRYANTISISLMILSVLTILTNYIFKLI